MATHWIENELRRFDPQVPLSRASTPPASWYTDPKFFDLEIQQIFGRNWLIAARADQVDAPRKFICGEIGGERYVIVRGEDNKLRAFYNVCRHHAAAPAQGEGTAKRFVCPYHGWTYGLDGCLLNAPETEDVEDFDPSCHGLVPMAVEEWGPLVFVCMGKNPRPLAGDLKQLQVSLEATDFEALTFVKRVSYTVKCNWKVYVDNYLDGGYHVVYLHRGLAGQLELGSYRTEVFDRFSIQSSVGAGASEPRPSERIKVREGSDFAERIGANALYAWVYPNLMINRYGSIMDTNWVIPVSQNETNVVFDYYFMDANGPAAEEFIQRSIAASDIVQLEDMDICKVVQAGLASRAYDQGRYSLLEKGEYHFHRLLSEDLQNGSG